MAKTDADFLPKNVKEQGEKADALLKGAKEPAKPKKATPAKQDPPAAPAEPAIPAKDPAAAVDPKDATPANAQPSGDFEQKYKVLQGKYDREIMEQRQGMETLTETVSSQAQVIENLNQVLQNLPANESGRAQADPLPAAQSTPLMDGSIFSGYGSEMVDFVNGVNNLIKRVDSLEASQGAVSNVPGNFEARMNTIEQRQVKSAKDTFYDALDLHVSDWGAINVDLGFKAWLKETDPMSDIPREAMLKRALETFNQNQAIAIFKGYKALNNPVAQPEPVNELEGMIIPDQTGNIDPAQPIQPAAQYATLEQFLEAQNHFVKKRITEPEFNKIANSYQAGLAAAKAANG